MKYRTFLPICAYFFLFATALHPGQTISTQPVIASGPSTGPTVIVIGFVGGFIKDDDPVHGEVQLAARLRKECAAGVNVETFENHRAVNAHRRILELLDTDHDGTLTVEEKQNARIILYGHSWGASESITLARMLEKDGIPVLLTVQVDSIAKRKMNDTIIPANVA